MDNMDVAEMFAVGGGACLVYLAGYRAAIREQSLTINPAGMDTAMWLGFGLLVAAALVFVYEKKMRADDPTGGEAV